MELAFLYDTIYKSRLKWIPQSFDYFIYFGSRMWEYKDQAKLSAHSRGFTIIKFDYDLRT